ncbi:MAG TPA: hypothetical protein VM120_20775 [Bryobacteraceae bacterium]|nr:hypothetical protein [Bryobacteraceae bacterium]
MRNYILVTLVLLGLTSVAAFAADITGQWVAQVPGRQGNTQETTFKLKADGDKLTGSITNPRGETQIAEGKITGDEISFVQAVEFNGRAFKLLYKGKVSGDEIKMTRTREGGQGMSQEFVAKKKTS